MDWMAGRWKGRCHNRLPQAGDEMKGRPLEGERRCAPIYVMEKERVAVDGRRRDGRGERETERMRDQEG
jgi:hypothetical protein